MFPNQNDYSNLSQKELLLLVMKELDEVKRYAANTYSAVDKEVQEIHDFVRKMDRQFSETDKQIDKIERFERVLNDIDSKLKGIERKL